MSEKDEDMFDELGAELQTPSNTDTSVKNVIVPEGPDITDPAWNDYVMGLFMPEELIDGKPLVDGLRRVSQLVLGRIVSASPTQVFPPQAEDHHGRATVVFEIIFEDNSRFADVADVWEGNTDDTFCAFATATASTRAEARALRKALRLRTCSAEEMTKKDTASIVKTISKVNETSGTVTGEYNEKARMTSPQANFISVRCKEMDINAKKLFNTVLGVENTSRIDKQTASTAIDTLNGYLQALDTIPGDILGFENGWES